MNLLIAIAAACTGISAWVTPQPPPVLNNCSASSFTLVTRADSTSGADINNLAPLDSVVGFVFNIDTRSPKQIRKAQRRRSRGKTTAEPVWKNTIVVNNELNSSAVYQRQKLTPTQVTTLQQTLVDTTTFTNAIALCWLPHHGFVYYRDGSIVGYVNVCFLCSNIGVEPQLPNTTTKKDHLYFGGLTVDGSSRIKALCADLGLQVPKLEKQP